MCYRESRILCELVFPFVITLLIIQIQCTSKLLSYEIERDPNKWKEKVESQ